MRVIVLGGGISGLCAGYEVLRRVPDASVVVLEAGNRVGGAIATEHTEDGFLIERGPDAMLTQPDHALKLAQELGLEPHIMRTSASVSGAFILRSKRLHPVPDGFALVAPGNLKAFLRTPLVSARGKARALLEPLLAPLQPSGELSLQTLVQGRLGQEVLDYLAEPLAGGIYGADPRLLSMHAALPKYAALAERGQSLIGGVRRLQRGAGARAAGARYGLFISFQGGCGELVAALADAIGPERIQLGQKVESIGRYGRGWQVNVTSRGAQGVECARSLRADAVVCALPAARAARVLREATPELACELGAIPFGSSAVVTFAFEREQIAHPLDAYGFVVPKREGLSLRAATFSSVKWPGRAPIGMVLLRAFVGGSGSEGQAARPEAELVSSLLAELRLILGIRGEPRLHRVDRYVRAMPRYHLGHQALVARIEDAARHQPHFALAGNSYRGVGIPEAIRSGRAAASALVSELS